jgi:hypothetical protein
MNQKQGPIMSKTWQADDNSTESSLSPDLRKQLEAAAGRTDDNETVPSMSPDLREQLKAAAGQRVDNDTSPFISSNLRAQLKAAGQSAVTDTMPAVSPDMSAQLNTSSKTVKIDPHEFDLEAKTLAGNALLKNHSAVVFALIDSEILLPIHVTNRMIIGRSDVESGEKVDIDLTPYGGRERGVSRRHAILYRTRFTVSLVDLNSSNGTYLNGLRLIPHQPRLLREGDEVRLGNMRFHTYFER